MKDGTVLDVEDFGQAEPGPDESATAGDVSRRSFVQGASLLASGVGLGIPGLAEAQSKTKAHAPVRMVPLSVTINGEPRQLSVDPRISLLDLLRERMSGNICRCGAYPGIVAAVQQAFRQG